ncbi:MAG: signal peptidase I [Actinobacteria bacterium]|nr:signal peptidase I [Actinomycetota bacterium]
MDPDIYYSDTPKKGFFDNLGGYVIEFIETIVIFGAIFASIYLFVAQFHKVSGSSMVPTLYTGDYLITEKITYKFKEPQRGQIIVLKNPRDESQDFIKRIIAIPGDTLQISNNTVYLNGQPLQERYLPPGTITRSGAFVTEKSLIKVADNQYFVFGDNREHSSDSREWGPVTKEEIVGRALFRYWPLQSIGLLTNK